MAARSRSDAVWLRLNPIRDGWQEAKDLSAFRKMQKLPRVGEAGEAKVRLKLHD